MQPSRVASTIKCKGYVSSSTPDAPYPPPRSSSSTTSRLMSTAPYTFNSTTSLHLGSVVSLPHSIPLPRSFTNAIPRPSARPSPERQRTRHSVEYHSLSAAPKRPSVAQKRPSTVQPQRFGCSHVGCLTSLPSQQQPLPAYPPIRPYRDEHLSLKELPSPFTVDNASDTASPMHNGCSITPLAHSHGLYQYPTSLHTCSSPHFSPPRHCSFLSPSFCQPENSRGQQLLRSQPGAPTVESQDYTLPLMPNAHMPSLPSKTYQLSLNMRDEHKAPSSLDIPMVDDERYSTTTRTSNLALIPTTPAPSSLILQGPAPPQTFEGRQDKVFAPLDRSIITQRSCSSTSTHTSNTRDLGNLKDNAKIGGPNKQVTKEVEVAKEGGEVAQVLHTHSPSVQLTPVQGEVTRGLDTVFTRKSSSSTLSRPLSMASWPSSMVSLPSSMARTPSPSSASQSMPTTLYASNTNSNPHRGSTNPLPCPIRLPHSFAKAIPQASTCSSPSTALQSTSMASYTSDSTANPHQGPTILLPSSIPSSHSFTKTIPQVLGPSSTSTTLPLSSIT